jgi:N-sulfoglucosamine sulfohydrolase
MNMSTRPNILYIHSHDTGRIVQPYGHQVPTPNIQLLADQGILFREAFCAAPTCSGSRASLLTGEYNHQNGMFGLAHRGWKLNDYSKHWVHTLRKAGYTSTMIGEQHISTDPDVIGYDRVIDVDTTHANEITPLTVETLRSMPPEPWFMSVGFFETHRNYAAPTSVRDTLYSRPPGNLPDTPETRHDIAAFKSSARSLDQGIGAVLQGLHETGLTDRTVIICTTDHGIAFPHAKATLYDRGTGVMMLMRGPGGFTGGKVIDAMVTHLDVYPTLCEVAGVETPEWCEGKSLMPLIRGEQATLHDEIFAETTYHAAYQPHRSIRTERYKYIRRFDDYPYPVLANCDDSATKDLLVERGWGTRPLPAEQLFDLSFDPLETDSLHDDPEHAGTLANLRERLLDWMRRTDDPLLDGPIDPPPGAIVSGQDQISPDDPPRLVRADPTIATSS